MYEDHFGTELCADCRQPIGFLWIGEKHFKIHRFSIGAYALGTIKLHVCRPRPESLTIVRARPTGGSDDTTTHH